MKLAALLVGVALGAAAVLVLRAERTTVATFAAENGAGHFV